MQDGVKSTKSNRQMLDECHEVICKKLGTGHPMQMANIYEEVIEYLTFLRKMRPNDNSISFIDDIKKDSFSLSSEIAKRGLNAVNDYIKAVNIASDYFGIKEHSDNSLVGVNNESFIKEKFIIHIAYCYNQVKSETEKRQLDIMLHYKQLYCELYENVADMLRDNKINPKDPSILLLKFDNFRK